MRRPDPRHRRKARSALFLVSAFSTAALAALSATSLGACQGASSNAQASSAGVESGLPDGAAPTSNSGTGAGDDAGGGSPSTGGGTTSGACSGNPVFCDDYSQSSLAGAYTTYHGSWTRSSGSYAATDTNAWERPRATLSPSVSSFDVTLRGSTVGDDGLGLVYGASQSGDDGYAVVVHPAQFQGVYLKQLIPGQADVALANAPLPAGLAGTPLTLRVVRQGTQVTVWLNGAQVLQGNDIAPGLEGHLGLLASDTDQTTTATGASPGATFTLLRVDAESGSGTGTPTPDAGPPPTLPPGALSYMIGYGGSNTSNATIAQAESIFGRPMDMLSDGVTVDSFQYGPYTSGNGRPLGKVFIFEMMSMPWDSNQSLTDMGQAASGAYDGVYTQMAQAIAGFGMPVISVRPGHEMNGNWYPWSAVSGNGHNATTANYIANFHRVAQIIRKYNPNASIEWCVAMQPNAQQWSGSSASPLDYWVGAYDPVTNPGGADVISMDFYEGDLGTDFNNNILGGLYGLNWLVSFAQQNGVKIGFSEVASGLGNSPGQGGGCPCSNDATFTQNMINWLNALPPGLLRFFVHSPWAPADDLMSSGNAAIQQVWANAWGKTYFGGDWWKGPKVPSQP